ncbi:hypothetical protein DLAC_01677 [Tieghemostelium lacteum]|uniref:PIG-P domain-containing protein n=1 Tax=Tieghemostelium lacteum TaxID=361077 RepID=A0A152A623_TIELA|nr:hypothetical protein DLAC_01677 [Tieghemostelium lacteum]|eukprot:KYR01673.1 hypothetical protein DLAC_01677 [Tieghemostelium lacteum]
MNPGHQRRLSQQNNINSINLNSSGGRIINTPPLGSSPILLGGAGVSSPLLPSFQLNPLQQQQQDSLNTGTNVNNQNDNNPLNNNNSNTQNNSNNNNSNTVQTVKQPEKKGANAEVYGFVYWIATFVGYIIYLLWAFIPEDTLHRLGMHYYPSKYWAIAIPNYLIVCILFGLSVYFAINLMITAPLESHNTFKDQYSQYESDTGHVYLPQSIPPLEDIPIHIVNQLLYQKKPNSTPLNLSTSSTGQNRSTQMSSKNQSPFSNSPLLQSQSATTSTMFKTPSTLTQRKNPLNTSSISLNNQIPLKLDGSQPNTPNQIHSLTPPILSEQQLQNINANEVLRRVNTLPNLLQSETK